MMSMLPAKERMEKLNELQKATVMDIEASWNIKKGVVCIRPTGFGKTFTAGRLLREKVNGAYKFKNVVFICPSEAVMMQFNNELLYEGRQKEQIPCHIFRNGKSVFTHSDYTTKDGVIIREMTYSLIARRFGSDADNINKEDVDKLFGKDVDLIIMDEFHNAGGEKTLLGLTIILEDYYKDVLKLGLTATYDRADSLDVGYELFGDACLTPEYTYAQAVEDGVLPAINYFCNDYKSVKEASDKLKELSELAKRDDRISKGLKAERQRFLKSTELVNMSTVIRNDTIEVIGKAVAESYSQKWIVFYPTCSELLANWKRVEKWYKKAWPNHEVQSIIVIDQKGYSENRKVVCAHGYHKFNPRKEDKVITLIFNVNMLLEAVHLDNVTGLLLFTNTKSPVKYYQTLGRVIDSKRETAPLVIDMMDGYQELFKKLQSDIVDANNGKHAASRKAKTVKTEGTAIEITGEQSSILTKLNVVSNKLTYQEFYTRLVKLGNVVKIRRAALEVMNGHIGLVTAARAEQLPVEMLANEIKDIQEKGEFSSSEVMTASKANKQKCIRIEDTGMIDPLSEENYVNVIYSEGGFMDVDTYNDIMAEFEAVMKHKKSKRGA